MRRFWLRLVAFFSHGRAEADLAREVSAHLDLMEASYRQRGMTADEARLAARRAFGGVEQAKDRHRDARSFLWLEDARQDVRYALRTLAKAPGFTTVAVLALALGIGANTAFYSVLQAVWIDAVPFRDPGSLVVVMYRSGESLQEVSSADVDVWRRENLVFDAMAVYGESQTLRIPGDTDIYISLRASASLFELVGGTPMSIGRPLVADDERPGAPPVTVLDHGFWQRRFGGDPAVLGQTLPFRSGRATIVGVTAPDFNVGRTIANAWLPYQPVATGASASASAATYRVLARLKPGVSLTQAREHMKVIGGRGASNVKDSRGREWYVWVDSLREVILGAPLRTSLFTLLAAAGLVLLIACANVASLLLARGSSRQRELAVRRALGAARHRIVRQLLVETGLVALVGAGIGVGLTFLARDVLVASIPYNVPRSQAIGVDGRVLAVTLLVTVFTTLIAGLVPAFRSAAVDPAAALSHGNQASTDPRRRRIANTLMAVEVTLALVVLSAAGLLLNSFIKLMTTNPGFDPRNVVTFSFAGGAPPAAQMRDVLETIRRAPRVVAATVSPRLSLAPGGTRAEVEQPDGSDKLSVRYHSVGNDYFKVMSIPILAGRAFTADDRADSEAVVIVTASLARRFWPGETAVNRSLVVVGEPRTIVGIIDDVRDHGLAIEPDLEFYEPLTQRDGGSSPGAYIVRTSGDPLEVFRGFRANIETVVGRKVEEVRTLDEALLRTVHLPRFRTRLFGSLGVLVLVLMAVGIFSVTAHAVVQRRRELGIRLAVGATRPQILRLVLRDTAGPLLLGIVLGLLGALSATRVISGFLYSTTPTDPLTFVAVISLVVLTGLLAAWIPTIRGTRINLVDVLKAE